MKKSVTPLFLLLCIINAKAAVLPSGAEIISGDVTLSTSQNMLFIGSEDKRNVISWDDFSVSKDGKVVFDDNSYLNIVRSDKASVINGSVVTANEGEFYLFNPNGITLGKDSSLKGDNIVLSTSKLTDEDVAGYIDSGEFNFEHKGMGKVKLLGSIVSENLTIDGSQVIIADIQSIEPNAYKNTNENPSEDTLHITSSTKRIDIGGAAGTDIENTYHITADDGLVDQTGKKAICDAEDFKNIANDVNADYFIADDIDLGKITAPVTGYRSFTGSIDGAFNTISYELSADGASSSSFGLFSSLDGASISNLKIKDASVLISNPAQNTFVGALCGTMKSSSLNTVEADSFEVSFEKPQGHQIYIGSIAGNAAYGTELNLANLITGSLKDTTIERVKNNPNYTAGSIFGLIEAPFYSSEVILTQDKNGNDTLDYAGSDLSQKANQVYKASDYSGFYIDDNGFYSNAAFYCPFFIPEDISIDYDKNAPVSYNFGQMTDSTYFKAQNYVTVTRDYFMDTVSEPGIYTHTFKNHNGTTRFYFVKGNEIGSTLTQSIAINKVAEVKPENNLPADEIHHQNSSQTETSSNIEKDNASLTIDQDIAATDTPYDDIKSDAYQLNHTSDAYQLNHTYDAYDKFYASDYNPGNYELLSIDSNYYKNFESEENSISKEDLTKSDFRKFNKEKYLPKKSSLTFFNAFKPDFELYDSMLLASLGIDRINPNNNSTYAQISDDNEYSSES